MDTTRTPVLVVGAGLAGAATSMFLADRGIDPLVVERRLGTSLHTKAYGQNPRTMELLRAAGVADEVLAANPLTASRLWDALSPLPMGMATQGQMELIMLGRARELGAQVRFDTELVSFKQDTLGVSARLVHRPTGTLSQVRADYLVAADGRHADIVAHAWRSGRVFRAGGAAKMTPPTGGLSGDAAIGDGFDLAWKLAAVLRGQAGPALLDSYDPERRAVAELMAAESVGYMEIVFGIRQRSEAVLIDDEDPAAVEDPHRPSGRPGFRAPHVPLRRDGVEVSTVDFFGRDWVLLTGTEGGVWHQAAKHVAARLGLVVRTVGLGPGLTDPEDRLVRAYGIGHGGASLVRPDGVVAWRTDFEVADAAGTLQTVLTRLLDRVPIAAEPAGTAR